MAILSLENVSYHYIDGREKLQILEDCSYEFEKGKFYTILGPSGSGKTTTLALGGGLDKPIKGKIKYEGKDIKKIGLTKFRQKYISIVFQSYNLITYMTALQNVTIGMEIAKQKGDKEKALSVLKDLGIKENEGNRPVLKLSGGQQQRIAIARALARDVDLILADEPTGNLDVDTERDIIDIFKELANEDKCIIVVTHSEAIAKRSDVVLTLKDKKIEEITI